MRRTGNGALHTNRDLARHRSVQSPGGVAATLATMIAGAICTRYSIYRNASGVPILSHSLSVILGFYFGSKVTRTSN